MKKFLTILLLICAVANGYAQNNSTVESTKSSKEFFGKVKNFFVVDIPNFVTNLTDKEKRAERKEERLAEKKAEKQTKINSEIKAEKKADKQAQEPKSPLITRVDREINSNKFVFKGESMVGLTISYGTIDSEDSDLALIIDNINLNGQMFTVKPHYGYFYRDNNAIGARLGYSYAHGTLNNASLNLGEANDISLSLSGLAYTSRGYSAAIYHRSYMAIDRKGRFGLFAEWELSGGFSESRFDFSSGESVTSNVAHSYNAAISFAPGVAVYIFPNVCASLSFGMGGLQYKHIKQMDAEGNFTGQRDFSKLRFGLNLAQINIGVNIHLWNKKKDK